MKFNFVRGYNDLQLGSRPPKIKPNNVIKKGLVMRLPHLKAEDGAVDVHGENAECVL